MRTVAQLTDILTGIDALLEPGRFRDYGPNGLQVPGPDEIGVIVTGVSAQVELFERAASMGADLVLTHHGILWDRAPRRIDAPMKRRLQLLFDHDMALASYHLPLDAHLEVGNAALLAAALGGVAAGPFGAHGPESVGALARFDEPIARDALLERVREVCGQAPIAFPAGPESVRTLGIVTGAGADYVLEAAELGLDAFLTGEPAERSMADSRERGITFIAAGHYATETFGIRRLGEIVQDRHGVRAEFLHIPNPI
jgi:dinuclear metal center YbgI/SA1388 family protein